MLETFDPPYHMMERHWIDPKTGKSITFERRILKNNRIYLKCPGLLPRRTAREIVKLLNDLAPLSR